MNDLDRTLILKQPARVVAQDSRPVVLMTAPYHAKADLTAAVHRLARRGEVRPLQARPAYNTGTGLWQIEVLRLRQPAPAWIKPAVIVVGVLLMLGALGALAAWMLSTLASLPLGAFLAGALVTLLVILRIGKPATVTVTQSVTVRR